MTLHLPGKYIQWPHYACIYWAETNAHTKRSKIRGSLPWITPKVVKADVETIALSMVALLLWQLTNFIRQPVWHRLLWASFCVIWVKELEQPLQLDCSAMVHLNGSTAPARAESIHMHACCVSHYNWLELSLSPCDEYLCHFSCFLVTIMLIIFSSHHIPLAGLTLYHHIVQRLFQRPGGHFAISFTFSQEEQHEEIKMIWFSCVHRGPCWYPCHGSDVVSIYIQWTEGWQVAYGHCKRA